MSIITNNSQQSTETCDVFKATRNYTGPDEQACWWYYNRWSRDNKSVYNPTPYYVTKQEFRTRRKWYTAKTVLRINFENSNEIGAFMKLTNSYCLVCSDAGSEVFHSTIKDDLPDIPVINTSLAGCKIVGRMCVGNKNGLLLPETVYDTELQQIRNELPDSVKIQTIEERLSALGNVIVCNDHVALVHPDISKESEEIIADTLQVEVFRHMIGNSALVGSYCILNNKGGLVCSGTNNTDIETLSSLLQLPLVDGTVNTGSKVVASGLVGNDWIAYAGMKTTSSELALIESAFKFNKARPYLC